MDSSQDLKAIALRWVSLWQGGDLSSFDDLHAENFIDKSPDGRDPDRAAFRASIEALYDAFPDFYAKVEDLVVDTGAHKVVIRWMATGTHHHEFLGIPPSEHKVYFSGIEIIHIEDGKVVERWGEWDGLTLLGQLRG